MAMSVTRELLRLSGCFLLLLLIFVRESDSSGTGDNSKTVEFDVQPGGVVHSFSQRLGEYTCVFTYASQGGTNERWHMSVGISEDDMLFSCSVWRPQGTSYLFFTQFKAEVKGGKIEYANAYSRATGAGSGEVPLKSEEFEVGEHAVTHREGAFQSQLYKVLIVAKTPHDEL
ncbi:myeloid-derived growth factor-like [Protopterus annectens]|uniref:myeloid-derived growth factor-like n=1 Tax=Protopterus annectens TaxID=7888 RepID=UPI001CFAD5C0|nr:myeloid-derived growth factor-like [Protopterus annectens]